MGREADTGWTARSSGNGAIEMPLRNDERTRREAMIYVIGRRGQVRASRGIVSRALRAVLGDFYAPPYKGDYMTQREVYDYERAGGERPDLNQCSPVYRVNLTDSEAKKLWAEIDRLSKDLPWPAGELYHD